MLTISFFQFFNKLKKNYYSGSMKQILLMLSNNDIKFEAELKANNPYLIIQEVSIKKIPKIFYCFDTIEYESLHHYFS